MNNILKKDKRKVIVAMSGGVDSSVAAALLKKQGFNVLGIFLKFWKEADSESENKCCSIESQEVARRVTTKLNIPIYTLNYEKKFKKAVVDYFIAEYKDGRTPNPCVQCNKFIKFGWLLDEAKKLGADYLATGHYVRKSEIRNPKFETNSKFKKYKYKLLMAKDKKKDQSYFLWALMQSQLEHLLFPIGDYMKDDVRAMAKKWGLPSARRRDSQEICFVRKNVRDFLKKYIKVEKGPIQDSKGKKLGEHIGLPFYTIGQRKDLGEFWRHDPEKKEWTLIKYVIEKNIEKNALIIGTEKDLYKKELTASDLNWIRPDNEINNKKIGARIRYGHPATPCRISKLKTKNEKGKIVFEKSVRAITPGQSVVFYDGEVILGGGIIEK